MPLLFSTSFIVLNFCKPSIIALKIFIEVLEPKDLANISRTPTNSKTVLAAPPAIIPVPLEAGFNKVLEAPNLPIISCGIVVPDNETLIKFF